MSRLFQKHQNKLKIYLIGSLRNENVEKYGQKLLDLKFGVFNHWYAVGPEADDYWKKFHVNRGDSQIESILSIEAVNTFDLDHNVLFNYVDCAVMILPCGKSGHLESGFIAGIRDVGKEYLKEILNSNLSDEIKQKFKFFANKKIFILLDNNVDRYDVMYNFSTEYDYKSKQVLFSGLCKDFDELVSKLKNLQDELYKEDDDDSIRDDYPF